MLMKEIRQLIKQHRRHEQNSTKGKILRRIRPAELVVRTERKRKMLCRRVNKKCDSKYSRAAKYCITSQLRTHNS